MADSYTPPKWDWLNSKRVPTKSTSVSGIPDVKWKISNVESCETLLALGAPPQDVSIFGCPSKVRNSEAHCLHKYPKKSIMHCCKCERTFVDNTSSLEDEGLI